MRIRDVLPRFRVQSALEAVGLPARELEPASNGQVRMLGPASLVEAASFSLAVPVDLAGRSEPVVMARAAAAQVGRSAGLADAELREHLGVTTDSLRRYLKRTLPPGSTMALRNRLAIQLLVAEAAGRSCELTPLGAGL